MRGDPFPAAHAHGAAGRSTHCQQFEKSLRQLCAIARAVEHAGRPCLRDIGSRAHDFIPVLGQLDDLIIVPLGIWLALKLIPEEVMTEHRRTAEEAVHKPVSYVVTALIVIAWLLAVVLTGWLAVKLWKLLIKL